MRKAIGAVLWGLAVGGVFAVLLLAARIITQVDFKADLGTPSARSQGETPVIEVQGVEQTSPSQGESANGSSSSSSPVGSSSEASLASSTSGRFRVISSQPASENGTANPSVPTESTSPPPTSPTALAPSGT